MEDNRQSGMSVLMLIWSILVAVALSFMAGWLYGLVRGSVSVLDTHDEWCTKGVLTGDSRLIVLKAAIDERPNDPYVKAYQLLLPSFTQVCKERIDGGYYRHDRRLVAFESITLEIVDRYLEDHGFDRQTPR